MLRGGKTGLEETSVSRGGSGIRIHSFARLLPTSPQSLFLGLCRTDGGFLDMAVSANFLRDGGDLDGSGKALGSDAADQSCHARLVVSNQLAFHLPFAGVAENVERS